MGWNELDWLIPKFKGIELQKDSLIIRIVFSAAEIKESFCRIYEIDEFSPENFINYISLRKYFSVEYLFYRFLVNEIDEEPEDYFDLFEKSIELTDTKISINDTEVQFIFVLYKDKSVCIRDFIKANYISYKVAKLNKETFQNFLDDLPVQMANDFDSFVSEDYYDSIIDGYLKRKLENDKSEFIDW